MLDHPSGLFAVVEASGGEWKRAKVRVDGTRGVKFASSSRAVEEEGAGSRRWLPSKASNRYSFPLSPTPLRSALPPPDYLLEALTCVRNVRPRFFCSFRHPLHTVSIDPHEFSHPLASTRLPATGTK